jgi:hypothetical protein
VFGVEKDGSFTSDRNKPVMKDLEEDAKTWTQFEIDWVRVWQPTDDVAYRRGDSNTTEAILGKAPTYLEVAPPGQPSTGPAIVAPPAPAPVDPTTVDKNKPLVVDPTNVKSDGLRLLSGVAGVLGVAAMLL